MFAKTREFTWESEQVDSIVGVSLTEASIMLKELGFIQIAIQAFPRAIKKPVVCAIVVEFSLGFVDGYSYVTEAFRDETLNFPEKGELYIKKKA